MTTKCSFSRNLVPLTDFDGDDIDLSEDLGSENKQICSVKSSSSHLLLVALLEHICAIYAPNPAEKNKLFKEIVKWLVKNQMVSPLNGIEELSSIRSQFRASFTRLVQTALKTTLNPESLPSSSVLSLPAPRPTHLLKEPSITVQDFITSRYKSDFTEICRIGKGAYGSVHQVLHKLDKKAYAVKKIAFNEPQLDVFMKIIREVRYMAELDHNHVVRYYGAWLEMEPSRRREAIVETDDSAQYDDSDASDGIVFEDSTSRHNGATGASEEDLSVSTNMSPREGAFLWVLYIQMELCDETLADWIELRNSCLKQGQDPYSIVDEEQNLHIIKQLLGAVHYMHQKDVVHRDLKPRNIFLNTGDTNYYVVKVGDLGLARHLSPNKPSSPLTPHPGVPTYAGLVRTDSDPVILTSGVGTTIYAAPEQLECGVYDEKCDMYSIGLILFEMYHPFSTQMERVHVLNDIRKGKIPQAFIDKWPLQAEYIKSLTDINPDNRPSATELLRISIFKTKSQIIACLRDVIKEKDRASLAQALELADMKVTLKHRDESIRKKDIECKQCKASSVEVTQLKEDLDVREKELVERERGLEERERFLKEKEADLLKRESALTEWKLKHMMCGDNLFKHS